MWCRLLLVLGLTLLAAGPARADRLDLIEKRGTLIVGIKSDYPPFGMLDANGRLIGLEADLARELARRLGVALELVAVTSANRLQKLEDGNVDVLIATLGDTQQRREIATLVEPNYYASGVSLLAPRTLTVSQWADLRGRRVCATQGALFNKSMAQRYLLDLQVFNGTRDAKLALRDGRCVGWIYDDIAIANDLTQPEWRDYTMPLPSTMTSPWAIAIARTESGGRLERAISDAVADWHRSGLLIELERRWGLPPSRFLAEMNALWTARDEAGDLVCRRLPDGGWPAQCRNQALLTSVDVSGLYRVSLLIREHTGLNITLLHDPYDRRLFLDGLRTTLELVFACILGSIALGLGGALLVDARIPVLSPLVRAFATMTRMTPPLLQIYVLFFGVGSYVVTRYGWTFDGFVVAALALSAYAGASNLFAFAEALGLARRLDAGSGPGPFWGEVLRLSYPPVMAASVNVVKATGMASTIAVPELISAATSIVAEQGNADVMMNLLMAVYFLIVLIVVRLFSLLERRVLARVPRTAQAGAGGGGRP